MEPVVSLVPAASPVPVPAGADADARFVELWLQGRSRATQRAYLFCLGGFRRVCDAPLARVRLSDLHEYALSVAHLSPASQRQRLAAIKSLLSYAHETGYLPYDVGRVFRLPKAPNRLAERILPESAVHAMFTLERNPRNKVLLRFLYATGLRVSEACALQWKHLAERGRGGQVSVVGKGSKERVVLVPERVWLELLDLGGYQRPENYLFRSRKGGGLKPWQVHRIVRAAAVRADIRVPVSPHFLRHACATHSLERGCPIHVVQATLGHSNVATTGKYLHCRPNDGAGLYLAV